MKKLSALLISSTFLLFTAVSCNSEDYSNGYENGGELPQPRPPVFIPVESVTLNFIDVTFFVGGENPTLIATILPENATNQNITWESSNNTIATVQNGIVTPVTIGQVEITATSAEDMTITATSAITIVYAFDCNLNTPGWGNSLGTVSFYTNQEWMIEGNGIFQIWSDAVTAVNCQKYTFWGGSRQHLPGYGYFAFNFAADCRSNSGFPGDFFSWCAVVRFADQLCPYPWRVPTTEDFRNLDIAMGGSGDSNNRGDTPQFVQDNYITRWGGRFGGRCFLNGVVLERGSWGHYWAQTDIGHGSAHLLSVGIGNVAPQQWNTKYYGFTLRCVR